MQLLSLLILLLPITATAGFNLFFIPSEDIRTSHVPQIVGDTLYIKGRIDSHIYDYLAYSDQELKSVKTIDLNSYGGDLNWGIEIARKIASLGKATQLTQGHVCASACLFLFAAGKERIAESGTWLGLHAGRLPSGYKPIFMEICFEEVNQQMQFNKERNGCAEFLNTWYDFAINLTNDAFTQMENYGVSPELRKVYFSFEDDPTWYDNLNVVRKPDWPIDATEALKFNLVTKVIYKSDTLTASLSK